MDESVPRWLNAHSHEPNPVAPPGDGAFVLEAGKFKQDVDLDFLRTLTFSEIVNCHIVSTGHGRSGPFRFGGVHVADLFGALLPNGARAAYADFVSTDSYGTRLDASMLGVNPGPLLAYMLDGKPMTRTQGLPRLIVPGETDDALHQVKWLATIKVMLALPR